MSGESICSEAARGIVKPRAETSQHQSEQLVTPPAFIIARTCSFRGASAPPEPVLIPSAHPKAIKLPYALTYGYTPLPHYLCSRPSTCYLPLYKFQVHVAFLFPIFARVQNPQLSAQIPRGQLFKPAFPITLPFKTTIPFTVNADQAALVRQRPAIRFVKLVDDLSGLPSLPRHIFC